MIIVHFCLRAGALLFLLSSCLPAAEPVAVERAREEVSQMRQLVAAGAASRRQLEAAERELKRALEEVAIVDTVYGEIAIEELTEEQAAAMRAAAGRRVRIAEERLAEAARLVAADVAPRNSLVPYEEDLASARRTVEAAEARARTLSELAAVIRAEAEQEAEPRFDGPLQGPQPVMSRFLGSARFNDADLKRLVLAYEKQFDSKLPISARGQTALHRSLGFDHRGRVDIAINPDDPAGRWLLGYLESANLPYFAFRASVPGQATAPHIHVGPPSLRIASSD